MARPNLNDALNNVEVTYSYIASIANDIVDSILSPTSNIINEINNEPTGLSVDSIRDFMVRLQLRSFELSDIKEKSALKATCAEALRKEKYARSFNEAEGTAGVKDNTALLASSEEIIVEALHNLVANLIKTKLDETHRMIDTLKSILMSKMQEAKLSMNAID